MGLQGIQASWYIISLTITNAKPSYHRHYFIINLIFSCRMVINFSSDSGVDKALLSFEY